MKPGESFTAAGLQWKDCTQYDKYKKNQEPSVFKTDVGDFVVSVSIQYGVYFFNCSALGLQRMQLPGVFDLKYAANAAITICQTKIKQLADAFSTPTPISLPF